MTSSPDFSSFLIYIPSDNGRKVYIDPELMVTFTEHVDPTDESGKAIANAIHAKLSADASGQNAGQASGEPNSFYMDFGEFTGRCIRVFYKVFQDDAGGLNRGPGVYIYNLRGFAHNRNNVGAGLFHMTASGNEWKATPLASRQLNNKVFRIGFAQDEGGLLTLSSLANEMLKIANQAMDKSDFDLYHSPAAVIEHGVEFSLPAVNNKIASPTELADILVNTSTIDSWSGKQHDKYTVYVFDESARLLAEALRLVKNKHQELNKFEFRLLAPHISFSIVESLARDLGAQAVLDRRVESGFSSRYQMLDQKSFVDNHPEIYAKFQRQLENVSGTSFIELWKHMDKELLNIKENLLN
ncbi:hypothetical protein [Thalassolituus oleivorans]|uniref:hypothetical protein n=1 Tax=Thalassolituus oleivorans TaxID=187493 RepID=UPI0023F35AB1|nr:hypothetical protein [Thalassolituus oleivorans]